MGTTHSENLLKGLENVLPSFEKRTKDGNSELFAEFAEPAQKYFYKMAKSKVPEAIETYENEYIKKELNTYDESEAKGKEKEKLIKERKIERRMKIWSLVWRILPYIWFQKEGIYIYVCGCIYVLCIYMCLKRLAEGKS